jgi:hypothetical protein
MAKKIKNFSEGNSSSRRSGEKIRRAARLFNRSIIYYTVLIVLAVLCGRSGEYDLSIPSANGFAICFLLIPAYIPLFVIGAVGVLIGVPLAEACGHEVILLGICDIM